MPNQISWQAHEFKHYPKSPGWYVTVLAIFIMLVTFFIIVESDYFAAVSMAIIGAIILIFARQTPQVVDIELNDRGVRFGSLMYPYKQLKYFWVVNNDRHRTVNFQTSAMLNNMLILELESQDPHEVRNFLIKYLPEHERTEETPIQKVMHRVKF